MARAAGSLVGSFRTVPHNANAEAAVLGALLANNRAFERVCDILRPEFFAIEAYGKIYAAIAQRINAGQLADGVVMISHFGDMEIANGDGTLSPMRDVVAQCMAAMIGIINVADYARTIRETWHRRELIEICTEAVNESHGLYGAEREDGATITSADIHETTEAKLYATAAALMDAGKTIEATDAVGAALAAAEQSAKTRGGLVGVNTGLEELNGLTGGWRPGNLILLGARPSMGKTSCALAFAVAAARQRVPVLFVSLEMDQRQIGARLLAGLAGVPGEYADRGLRRDRDEAGRFTYHDLSQVDWAAMAAVQRQTADTKAFPLVIDECPQRTMAAVRSRGRQMQRKRGLGLVVIDYLGLMRVPELARANNRVLEVSRISADAKALALELGVPVLLLSQLNRAVENRDDRRPRMSDLRDSGSLEQDADVIMFLHREHYYLKREPIKRRNNETDEKLSERQSAWLTAVQHNTGRAQLFIEKQRMGPIGTVDMAFNETNGWVSDLAEQGSLS